MSAEAAKKQEHEHGHDTHEADHGVKKDHGHDTVTAEQHGTHEAAAKAAEIHGVAREADHNHEKKDHDQNAAEAKDHHHAEKKPEDKKETHGSAPHTSKSAKKGALAVVWEKTKKFFNWLKNLVS